MDRAKRGASDTKPREAANVRGSEHTGHSGPRQRGRRAGVREALEAGCGLGRTRWFTG